MAKTRENPNEQPTPSKPEGGPEAAGSGQHQPAPGQAPQIQVEESKAITSYANFCRVTGTPEELIIDFALNPQPTGIPTKPIEIDQRIILNFYTAKRLLAALQLSLQRHEATFGVLETDIQKRIRPSAQRPPATS